MNKIAHVPGAERKGKVAGSGANLGALQQAAAIDAASACPIGVWQSARSSS